MDSTEEIRNRSESTPEADDEDEEPEIVLTSNIANLVDDTTCTSLRDLKTFLVNLNLILDYY